MPATPTSVSRATVSPTATSVSAASSATAKSLVPAVTMSAGLPPLFVGNVAPARCTVRASALTRTPGKAAPSAARCDSSARVTRKPSPFAASRSQINRVSSTVFPSPNTTSGYPARNAGWWSMFAKRSSSTGAPSRCESACSIVARPAATSSSSARTRSRLMAFSCVLGLEEFRVQLVPFVREVAVSAHREVVAEDSLDFVEAVHLMQSLAQLRGTRKPLHVPAQMLAELERSADRIDLVLLHHARMLERGVEPDRHGRRRRQALPGDQRKRLVEDPGQAERAARDHHARTSRLLIHAIRVFGRLDVAVANHRNVERLDELRDLLPARGTGIHLCARTRMQRDRPHARVLAAQADRHGIAHFLVPAAAYLAGDREMRRAHDGLDDLLHEPEILEASGSAVAPHDLLHRATEVDVDQLRLKHVRNERRGFTHRARLASEDLHADRPLIGPEPQLAQRGLVFPANPLCGQELRHDDIRAKAAAESPEWRLRHPRHRRQKQRHLVRDGIGECGHDSQGKRVGKCLQHHDLTRIGTSITLGPYPSTKRRVTNGRLRKEELHGTARVFL